MNLAEKYPHPGPKPEEPASADDELAFAYNTWVEKVRRHIVAKSVDALAAQPETTPEQTIAAVLGRAYLEDSLSSHSPFAGLF
jgi:hypothetical protein